MKVGRLGAILGLLCLSFVTPTAAKVRFGGNVFVGGHDFSHQTFDRRHRAIIRLYDRKISNEGCVVRADGRGGTVKTCRLRRIRR